MNFLNSSQLVSQLLGLQKEIYAQEPRKIVAIKDNYLNEFSINDSSVRFIFDHVNFKIVYISNNVEALSGYTLDDFYNFNILFLFKLFALEHCSFAYNWLKWSFLTQQKIGEDFINAQQAMCGIKAIRKDKQVVRVLFNQSALETNKTGIITVSIFTLNDITHLMKADFYWGRIEYGMKEKQFHHLISAEQGYKTIDILSDREKELVRLLAQGKESKEIGNLLFISPHTVDNHRRNMINKVGVRDTTGLIQICRMIGIIGS